MIAGPHAADVRTDLFDDSGTLVAEHHRQGGRERPVAKEWSVWHTPEAAMRTRTSRARGASSSSSTSSSF